MAAHDQPVWGLVASTKCPVYELQNPLDVGPAFSWVPCQNTAIAGCMELRVAGFLNPSKYHIESQPHTWDDGSNVWVAFASTNDWQEYSVIAREDGAIVAAFRGNVAQQTHMMHRALGEGRYEARFLCLLSDGSVSDPDYFASFLGELSPAYKSILTPPFKSTYAAPEDGAFANGLLAWWWTGYTRLSSMSAVDGSDMTYFAGPPDGGGEVGPAKQCPGLFLFEERTTQMRLMASDGKSPPWQFYAEQGDVSVMQPACMDGWVGWQKGIGAIGVGLFQKTELWASKYSANPAELNPAKVADLPFNYVNNDSAAGFGVYAFLGSDSRAIHLWDVRDSKHRQFTLADNEKTTDVAGVGREYVYVPVRPFGQGLGSDYRTIYRVRIDAIPLVP